MKCYDIKSLRNTSYKLILLNSINRTIDSHIIEPIILKSYFDRNEI